MVVSVCNTHCLCDAAEALLPESSRITNSLQGAMPTSASETEATEYLQTSTSVKDSEGKESIQISSVLKGIVPSSESSEIISSSTTAKEAVSSVISGTQGAEIVLPSPSLKGAVLPSAVSTEDRDTQRAGLNCMDCMDILIPSYPWGAPGAASRKGSNSKFLNCIVTAATSILSTCTYASLLYDCQRI